ncbi:pyruvate carboxylase subunit B [Variovorax sp. RA8]|uniref:pyruvate carboxylase subunit B n=1 Tax=Variovorax sp. (strain JCM 16519 / RA8) TaxID=662548 RepID=UPI000AFA4688|nr:pyruvate carboxylase subunit B [Variovorax sp. RA8]VTU27454.1 2-oxoglutarate carboxylase large subunit [Variovorax sp. RA8]
MNPSRRERPDTAAARSYGLVDVTLRDAHQCLWSTRMTTPMMTPILSRIDDVGYEFINILGGAVFDVQVRFLKENPWERIGILCNRLRTPCDGLTRGQSLYTFELFPDDVVRLNSKVLAARGLKVLTVYDALNDMRNIESSVLSAHEFGMQVNAMLVYTLSPVHTDDYYVERTRELVAQDVEYITVKDPTGLLTPQRAETLFPAIVAAAGGIPLQLHMHCQSGLATQVHEVAMRTGFRYGHTASEPLANGASHPSTEEIDDRARALDFATGIDRHALKDVSGYFALLAERERKPLGQVAQYDPALYEHQVPGGMISNLRSQLHGMGMEHRLPEILEEAARVRKDLGYPILVSPFAQYIVTQSVLNVVQGERYKTIPDEVRKYAMGSYGRLAGTPSQEFMARARIRSEDVSRERAAFELQPWVPRLRAELGASASEEDLLLAAFYDRSLIEPLKTAHAPMYESTTPLKELVRYIESCKDVQQARVRYGNAEITLVA